MVARIAAASLVIALLGAATAAAAPPGVPTLAAASSGSTVTFNITPAPTGDAATRYVIEASLIANGPIGATVPTVVTFFSLNNVPNGTYYLTVYAENADGRSAASATISVTVGGCTSAPDPPRNLQGSASGSLLTIAWEAPSGPPACPPHGYLIRAGTRPGLSDLAVLGTSFTTFSANVPPGAYYIRVAAFINNLESAPSNEALVVVQGAGVSGIWSGTLTARSIFGRTGLYTFTFIEADGRITATESQTVGRTPIRLAGSRFSHDLLILDDVDRPCERWTLIQDGPRIIRGESRFSCGPPFPISDIRLERQPIP